MDGKIYTPLKDGECSSDLVTAHRQLRLHRVVTSIREAVEWSCQAIKGSFGRLKVPLPCDNERRHDIIRCCFLLHNSRVRTVGINQIAKVFDLDRDEPILGEVNNDRVVRFYRPVM